MMEDRIVVILASLKLMPSPAYLITHTIRFVTHFFSLSLEVSPRRILVRNGYDYLGYYGRREMVAFTVKGGAPFYCFRGTFLAIDQWEGGGDWVDVNVDGRDVLRLKRESKFGGQSCEDDINPWKTFDKPTPVPLWRAITDPRPAAFRCYRELEHTFKSSLRFESNLNAAIAGTGSESFLLDSIVVTEGSC
jgi:hypothetical protein